MFFFAISNANLYPDINREAFHKLCNIWKIKNENLSVADIDRLFIATNVEIEEQETNEDLTLCRFEFHEIIVRIAKTKFFDKRAFPTLWESLEFLLENEILPNNPVKFEDNWRQEHLYNLEVDDLLRVNMDHIKRVFDIAK
jgi:hypothetical protein